MTKGTSNASCKYLERYIHLAWAFIMKLLKQRLGTTAGESGLSSVAFVIWENSSGDSLLETVNVDETSKCKV